MGSVKVELNESEIRKLLKGNGVKEMLASVAREHACGWETDTKEMGTRTVASIYSTDQGQIGEELDGHRVVGGLA